MRQLLAACVVGLFVVGSADGQIRIFFDFEGVGEQEDRGTVDPLSYGNPVVPQNTPTRLYIYGEFLSEDAIWLGISFDITVDGSAELTDIARYNHLTQIGPRWTGPVNGGFLNSPTNASFRAAAIINPQVGAGGMWNWYPHADINDPRHYRREWDSQSGELGTTLLGYVDLVGDGPAELYLTVEDPGFALLGGGSGRVNFGYGDASVAGNEFGVRTAIADATVVPEPTSLMLLALGALVMRRRR